MFVPSTGPACRRRSLLTLLAIPALLLFSKPVRAEDPAPAAALARSWSFEVVSGPSFGGPVSDLESAMRSAGFDDTTPALSGSWFGGAGTSHPYTSDSLDERISWWGAARRRLGSGPWHVGLGGGATEFGSVHGYRATGTGYFDGVYLDAGGNLATLAPMAWYAVAPALRVGAGPAFHRVDLDLGPPGNPGEASTRSWKPGFVVEAALTIPVDTPVFFVALAQYRWAGSATAGPWEGTSYSGARVEFPKTSVNVSHAFLALGIGGRF
jgi:hypothetical protein